MSGKNTQENQETASSVYTDQRQTIRTAVSQLTSTTDTQSPSMRLERFAKAFKFLIVDDEPEVIDLTSKLLVRKGGQCFLVTKETELRKEFPTDIEYILLDNDLEKWREGLKGRHLLGYLKERFPQATMILHSLDCNDPKVTRRYAEQGVGEFIGKGDLQALQVIIEKQDEL